MRNFFKYVLATIVGIFAATFIIMLFFFMIAGVAMSFADKQAKVEDKSMLVIDMERQITDRAPNDPFQDINIPGMKRSKSLGLDQIESALEKAVNDDRIKGIYLKLGSCTAGMASVEEIRDALIAFKDSSDKPIYAYGDSYNQKSYYLATVADNIVVHPMGAVDFRGLGGEMMFYTKALEKLGVEMQIIRHGKFKAAVEPFMLDKMSDENREQMLTYLGSLWNLMLQGISKERGISVDDLNRLADEVQTFKRGDEAVESGLVDAVRFRDEVLDDLREITGIEKKKGVPVIGAGEYSKVTVKGKEKPFSRNKIAVIYAAGDIGTSMGSGQVIIGDEIGKEIRKVRQDSSYKAVVLRVNSPGGAIFDSEVIWREVKLTAEEKTMVVSFGDVAASGGYYISCAADHIVAQPNTITGSIGVFGIIPNIEGLLNKKIGITTDVVKTNSNSDLISVNRPMTRYERDLMQQSVEDSYDLFISHVAEGRNMTKEQVDEIGQGRVWSGENAKELGLIDSYGGVQFAIKMAAEIEGLENYRTVSLPSQLDPFQQLFKSGADNLRGRFLKDEFGEGYRYYQQLKRVLETDGIMARIPYDLNIE